MASAAPVKFVCGAHVSGKDLTEYVRYRVMPGRVIAFDARLVNDLLAGLHWQAPQLLENAYELLSDSECPRDIHDLADVGRYVTRRQPIEGKTIIGRAASVYDALVEGRFGALPSKDVGAHMEDILRRPRGLDPAGYSPAF